LTSVTELKALNASAQMFDAAIQLLKTVLESCLQSNWHLLNKGTAKNAKDVLDETCCELFKAVQLHKKSEKIGDKSESRFHRMSHLVATKSCVSFLERIAASNVDSSNVAKLKNLLSLELCDVTLYLSHKSLHKRIYDLLSGEAFKENRNKFDEIKIILRSLSQAAKLLQVNHFHMKTKNKKIVNVLKCST
jgi:hypothetical protein